MIKSERWYRFTTQKTQDDATPSTLDNKIRERRRRTKLPTFSSGTPKEAQQWLDKFNRVSDYLAYGKDERLEELDVALEGDAIQWFASLAHEKRSRHALFEQAFLHHFGGGTQPTRNALAELKTLRQGSTPMSQFAPKISDLFMRAEIYSDALQLDYFSDRVHPKLQEAIYMRGAKNLTEAIAISTTTNPAQPAEAQNAQWSQQSSRPFRNSNQRGKSFHHPRYGRHRNSNQQPSNSQQPSNNQQRSSNSRHRRETRQCFNCGHHGHISRNCKTCQPSARNNAQHTTTSNNSDNSDNTSDWTNIFEHLSDSQQSTQQHTSNNQEANNNNNTLRFYNNIKIAGNNNEHRTLIDTGSTLSSIKRQLVKNMGITTQPCKPTTIRYGNQSTQLTTEIAIINFNINDFTSQCTMYVVDCQNEDIILGMDWMAKEDITLHPRTGTITKVMTNNAIAHQATIEQLLNKYPSLTQVAPIQTITNVPFQHRIDTGDANPVISRDYRRAPIEKDHIAKEVEDMLQRKVIRPSNSPWCSPVILIKKPDNTFRFCIDFRALNRITRKDKFPLPHIDDLLERLSGSTIFSTIDLKSGYWQIPVHPADRCKTAFIANNALYEFNVLPFGVCNGPSTFSRFMFGVLQGLSNAMVYLDDIIVFSSDVSAHHQHLDQVLHRLHKYNLKISLKKCRFFQSEVKYLGFIVSQQGIRSDPQKIATIQRWPTPQSRQELQRFLGFCAFHHKFISNLSTVAGPLYKLIKKDTKFNWTQDCQNAFISLKDTISKLPTLAYPNSRLPYELHTDASTFGLGAVLTQTGRPVAFASRTLTKAEKNYSATELECLAIVWALTYFHPYLFGATFTIFTDHAALKAILSTNSPRGRIARWILDIQSYTFTVVHRKGVENAAADALSRVHQNQQETAQLSIDTFKQYQNQDPYIKQLCQQGIREPFAWHQGVLFHKQDQESAKPVLPRAMLPIILRATHDHKTSGHFGVSKTLSKAQQLAWWPTQQEDIKAWIQGCELCQRYKISTTSTTAPMKPILPRYAGDIWAGDIATLTTTIKGNKHILVLSEYLTKWTVTAALPSYDSDHVANVLLYEVVLKYGTPNRWITDNGSNFISDAMNAVCKRLGISRSLTSVEYPQTDGLVERLNRTIKTSLAAYAAHDPANWDEYLPFVTFAYNTAKHSSTGYSPFQLMFGREPVIPLAGDFNINTNTYETEPWMQYLNAHIPVLHGQALSNIKRAQARQKRQYDKGKNTKIDYKPGDLILRRNLERQPFPKERWSGPFVIVKQNNEGTAYTIRKQDAPTYTTTANVKHMRPFNKPPSFEEGSDVRCNPANQRIT